MKLQRTYSPDSAWLLLAPIANVALLLMFFLLLCTSLVLQPGIAVEVPPSPFLLPPQKNPLIVSITAPPLSDVFFANQHLSLEELGTSLRKQNSQAHSIIIKADRCTPLWLVVEVLKKSLKQGYSVVLATQEQNPR